MNVFKTGSISGVSQSTWLYSDTYDFSRTRQLDRVGYLLAVTGDSGKTGASCQVVAQGSYGSSGVSWFTYDGAKLIVSGTTVTGQKEDGTFMASIPVLTPFLRLAVLGDSSATTCSTVVNYALMGD